MIKVFGTTDTVFTSNGDIVLQPFKAKIHKEDNGDYYLDLECGLEYLDYITANRVITANTPQGDQAFRIRSVTRSGKRITARCWHISYDTLYNHIVYDFPPVPTSVVQLKDVVARLASSTVYVNPEPTNFTITSDSEAYTYQLGYTKSSLYSVLLDMAIRFDCHLVRDNFNIAVNSSIGTDNGLVVRYGSNIKDISKDENWNDVCTRLFPTGKDGVKLLSGVVDSSTQYDQVFPRAVDFNQDNYNRSDYNSQQDYVNALRANLLTQAEAYLAEHCVPEVTYSLKAYVDSIVDIGDTVKVIDERLGIDILTAITSFEYDCISEIYTDVSFGNAKQTARSMGRKVSRVEQLQQLGIIGDKQIIFNPDNTINWTSNV